MNALPIAATAHAVGPRGAAKSSGRPGSGDAFQGALDAQSAQSAPLRMHARTGDEARQPLRPVAEPSQQGAPAGRPERRDVRGVALHADDRDRAGDAAQSSTPAPVLPGAPPAPVAPTPPVTATAGDVDSGADPSGAAAMVAAGDALASSASSAQAVATPIPSVPAAASPDAPAPAIPAAGAAVLPAAVAGAVPAATTPSTPAQPAPASAPQAPVAQVAAASAPLGGAAASVQNRAASAPTTGAPATVSAPPIDPLAGLRIGSVGRPGRPGPDDDRVPAPRSGDPAAFTGIAAAAPAAPLQQPAAVAPLALVAPPAPVDPAEATLAAQLTPPIAALAARGEGEHVVTVRITPDNLGAVTVRAHVVAGSMRVELFATEPHAREALAAMLPDLRRDLAGTDGTGSATVGLGGETSARSDARGSGSDRGPAGRPAPAAPSATAPAATDRSPWRTAPTAGRLDVLA